MFFLFGMVVGILILRWMGAIGHRTVRETFDEWSLAVRTSVGVAIVWTAYQLSCFAGVMIRFGCWISDQEMPTEAE